MCWCAILGLMISRTQLKVVYGHLLPVPRESTLKLEDGIERRRQLERGFKGTLLPFGDLHRDNSILQSRELSKEPHV